MWNRCGLKHVGIVVLYLLSRLVAVAASQYARPRRGQGSRGGYPSLACHVMHHRVLVGHIVEKAAFPSNCLSCKARTHFPVIDWPCSIP